MHEIADIDWNVELRKIEREFDGLPPEPSPSVQRTKKMAELQARQRAVQRLALLGAWARLLLVAALAVALYWWPRAHDCGVDLATFLGAESMVVVGGLWIAAFTWRHRLAVSHGVALVLLIAGMTLLAAQTLPRFGYATVAGVHAAGWRCTAS